MVERHRHVSHSGSLQSQYISLDVLYMFCDVDKTVERKLDAFYIYPISGLVIDENNVYITYVTS